MNHLHTVWHVLFLNGDIEVLLDVHDLLESVHVDFGRTIGHCIELVRT